MQLANQEILKGTQHTNNHGQGSVFEMALRMILKRFRLLRWLYLYNIWESPVSLQSNANKLQLNSILHDKDIVDNIIENKPSFSFPSPGHRRTGCVLKLQLTY